MSHQPLPLPSVQEIGEYPEVWGPPYWNFLHTMSFTYPEQPSDIFRRRYKELWESMPLFLPNREMGQHLATLLEKYPVDTYLDNRQSLVYYTHFMHNKINDQLGRIPVRIDEFLTEYKRKLKRPIVSPEDIARKKRIFMGTLSFALIGILTASCYYFGFFSYYEGVKSSSTNNEITKEEKIVDRPASVSD